MAATGSSTVTGRTGALLDELVEVFLAEGFLHLNLGELATRLNCSKSTLYSIAPSKEQLIVAVVRAFFRRATARIEESLDPESGPVEQIGTYLTAVSAELAPASPAFFAGLEVFSPAGEIYRRNTQAAADRVSGLVTAAAPDIDPTFLGAVTALMMESIHRGDIKRATGLDDSAAYRAVADLIVAGLAGDHERNSE